MKLLLTCKFVFCIFNVAQVQQIYSDWHFPPRACKAHLTAEQCVKSHKTVKQGGGDLLRAVNVRAFVPYKRLSQPGLSHGKQRSTLVWVFQLQCHRHNTMALQTLHCWHLHVTTFTRWSTWVGVYNNGLNFPFSKAFQNPCDCFPYFSYLFIHIVY